jgi:hypothetical protein
MTSFPPYPLKPRSPLAARLRAGIASLCLFAPLVVVNLLQALGLFWKPFAP